MSKTNDYPMVHAIPLHSNCRMRCARLIAWICCVQLLSSSEHLVCGKRSNYPWFSSLYSEQSRHYPSRTWRGGAAVNKEIDEDSVADQDSYRALALAVQSRLATKVDGGESSSLPPVNKIVKAFASLASAQKTFKGLDGAAYEAYHRTHSENDDVVDASVTGRAQRSAERAGATADGLGAAELCELLECPDKVIGVHDSSNGTLVGRDILMNITNCVVLEDDLKFSILVLYEASYTGGSGVNYGGIIEDGKDGDGKQSLSANGATKGRLLIIISDNLNGKLDPTLRVINKPARHVRLRQGLLTNEAASVQPVLYKAAGAILELLEPTLQSHNKSCAIHLVGRSLAGGVASLAAIILDGSLAIPKGKKNKRKKISAENPEDNSTSNATENNNATAVSLSGFGRGRSSAATLGAPPCVSSNVPSAFVTSILYGDDIVCRASKDSLDRFLQRTRRALGNNIIGRKFGWMTDTISLAASNLKNHAHGSEGEEARLAIPGRAYLVRPRRLGGVCSMHQVGGQLKGGREALRAALLWQLNDILLSKSLWKHHQLESYIQGLDRVQLRGLGDSQIDDD